jgi:transglutaminase-like putative cysteine protease
MLPRLIAFLALVAAVPAFADDPAAPRLGEATISKWRIGVVVRAPAGAATGILATTPVPMDWPEQQVKILSEEKSPNVGSLTYRTLDSSVKQLLITIPKLAAGDEASAIVTFEVAKSNILPPEQFAGLDTPKPSRDLAKFLQPSPYIESTDSKIKSLAAGLVEGKPTGWDRTATIFDWVRANVKYEFAETIKPATAALKDGVGDCEELSSLVIAMCRASKIPARAVWVPGHTYPEFHLQDSQGIGRWYPCQAAGADREFGGIREDRPILQKGDNFKVPEERGPQRYVKQFLSAKNALANPEVKFILERVKE